MTQDLHQLTGRLFRGNAGKMVSVLNKKFGYHHMDLSMDVVQETFEAALTNWKVAGMPGNPGGWLMQVAIRKMINALKKERRHGGTNGIILHEEQEAWTETLVSEKEMADSQLNLLLFFVRLHVPERVKIILTLYYLCGFGYAEIGNALLMKDEAVRKSIARAKEELQVFRPGHNYLQTAMIGEHLPSIRQILYLLFNEGYKTTRRDEGIREELCFEAIRLSKMLLSFNDSDGYGHALLSLMFFNAARFPARISPEQGWIVLEDQDRSLWLKPLVAEGFHHLEQARSLLSSPDRYYIEALIASIHCSAGTYAGTDWEKIVFLYHQLEKMAPGPFVVMNRIIAQSNLDASPLLLQELDNMAVAVKGTLLYTFYLCKAYLLHKMDRGEEAALFYMSALALTRSPADRDFIHRKLTSLGIFP